MIKYVFWDNDNTLIDNRDLHWRKHKSILKIHGIELDDGFFNRVYQNNGTQNWEWMTAEMGLTLPRDHYLKEIDEWYTSHLHEAPIRAGVLEAIALFKQAGCKQCVVSNGRTSSVMAAQKAKGLEQYFEFILCKEDYQGRKPDPAPYLTALHRMEKIAGHKINAADCLAIEDDPLGVTSAHKAGMQAIHRKLDAESETAPEANHSAVTEDEFLAAVKRYLTA